MNFAAIFGEEAGQFFAGNNVRAMKQFGNAGDGVVIRDGDEIHVAAPGLLVDFIRRAEAFRALDRIERDLVGLVAGVGVTMEVDPLHERATVPFFG